MFGQGRKLWQKKALVIPCNLPRATSYGRRKNPKRHKEQVVSFAVVNDNQFNKVSVHTAFCTTHTDVERATFKHNDSYLLGMSMSIEPSFLRWNPNH